MSVYLFTNARHVLLHYIHTTQTFQNNESKNKSGKKANIFFCTPLGHFVFPLGCPAPLRRFLGWGGGAEGGRGARGHPEDCGILVLKPSLSGYFTVHLSSRPRRPPHAGPGAPRRSRQTSPPGGSGPSVCLFLFFTTGYTERKLFLHIEQELP